MVDPYIKEIERTDWEFWKLKSEDTKGFILQEKFNYIQNHLTDYFYIRSNNSLHPLSCYWNEFYDTFGKVCLRSKFNISKQKRLLMCISRDIEINRQTMWKILCHHDDPYSILPLSFYVFSILDNQDIYTKFITEMNLYLINDLKWFTFTRNNPNDKFNTPLLLPAPWDHQNTALNHWWQNGGKGLIEMATGTGKTHVAFLAIEKLAIELKRPPKVMVVSDTRQLLVQWKNSFYEAFSFEPDVKWFETRTAMGLIREDLSKLDVDLLILDEIHKLLGNQFKKSLQIPAKYKMGLSATVQPGTINFIEKHIGKKVYSYTLKEAVNDGVIVPFTLKIFIVNLTQEEKLKFDKHEKSLAQLFTKAKNQGIFSLSKLCSTKMNNSLCKDYWALINSMRSVIHEAINKENLLIDLLHKYGSKNKIIVFFERIESIDRVSEKLSNSNINLFTVHSKATIKELKEKFQSFTDTKTGVLLGAKMINTGIDIPDADIGINVQFEKGRIQLIQRIGRIARKSWIKPEKIAEFNQIIAIPEENIIDNGEVQSIFLFSRLMDVNIEFFDKTNDKPISSELIIQALKNRLNITERIINDPDPNERIEAINQVSKTDSRKGWQVNSLIIAKWCDEDQGVRNVAKKRVEELCQIM